MGGEEEREEGKGGRRERGGGEEERERGREGGEEGEGGREERNGGRRGMEGGEGGREERKWALVSLSLCLKLLLLLETPIVTEFL